jgi:hypothetical protein
MLREIRNLERGILFTKVFLLPPIEGAQIVGGMVRLPKAEFPIQAKKSQVPGSGDHWYGLSGLVTVPPILMARHWSLSRLIRFFQMSSLVIEQKFVKSSSIRSVIR